MSSPLVLQEEIEGAAALRAQARDWDLIDLKGVEFQRLLFLAHSEGLLRELLQDIAPQRFQEHVHLRDLETLNSPKEPENRSTELPLRCRDCPHSAYDVAPAV
jgi:hypothetical protein